MHTQKQTEPCIMLNCTNIYDCIVSYKIHTGPSIRTRTHPPGSAEGPWCWQAGWRCPASRSCCRCGRVGLPEELRWRRPCEAARGRPRPPQMSPPRPHRPRLTAWSGAGRAPPDEWLCHQHLGGTRTDTATDWEGCGGKENNSKCNVNSGKSVPTAAIWF